MIGKMTPDKTPSAKPANVLAAPIKSKPMPRRSLSMSGSSKDLLAVDLARDRSRPLHVPPMLSTRPGENTLETLTIAARKIAPSILLDEQGQYYAMSRVLAHGTFGNIRLGLKYDPVISQVWIFKEIASNAPTRAQSFSNLAMTPAPKNRLSIPAYPGSKSQATATTPAISEGPEQSLAFEVNLMHQAHSALAPHAVLRTDSRAIMMMPLADTDLHNVWSHIYTWKAEARRPVVRYIVRQLLQDVVTLHNSGSAHRDIKKKNILMTRDGSTLLADYGMAVPVAKQDHDVGTYTYLDPVALFNSAHDKFAGDVHAVGVIWQSMLINDGIFWDCLWKNEALVKDIRSGDPSPENTDHFVKILAAAKQAYVTRNTPLALKKLNPLAKSMFKKHDATRAADPEGYPLIKLMIHPDSSKRISAQKALKGLNTGVLAPTDEDRAATAAVLGQCDRPIRDAADAEALNLESQVRKVMASRLHSRRNSLDSIRPLTTFV